MKYRIPGFFFLIASCFYACQNTDSAAEADVSQIQVNVTIEHLENTLMNLKSKEEIKGFLEKHPVFVETFYQTSANDPALIDRIDMLIHHPAIHELYQQTQQAFGNSDSLRLQFENAFRHIKFYYPDFKEPKIITTFAGLDNELVVTDSLIVIPLESFIGPGAKYRPQHPNYMLKRYDKPYLVPTVITLLSRKYNRVDLNDRSLLADMVFYGKSFEFTRAVIPNIADSLVVAYADSNLVKTWHNQEYVWGYFLDNKLLFETNDRIKDKYVSERPFVTEIGADCPGRIGQWVGWRIVSRYRTENPAVTLVQLMENTNAREIFEQSKYKGQTEE
ncbi:gliding motility protein [Emticicia sp. 21SJ11W-3]|uniref:gliding motility lipoprotein GldB n=1 Tax=Emticicia sp. 21SJ11W-3 TaxID=2916755 RepID=UPI00209EB680|nr:gliding motility protein [Emticicia sp. 21SJ11W-3]UTA68364.1 gliding motility protein [Emticicia sp. 21SJ11W-3]